MKNIIAVIALILIGAVMTMSFEDETNAQAHYCAMVADGLWPAYRAGEVNCAE